MSIKATPTPAVTNRVLEDSVLRAIAFIRGVGLAPNIRTLLESAGYTDAVHLQGWVLARTASGVGADGSSAVSPVSDAVRELAEFNDSGFTRIEAALTHLHPAESAFVFKGVAAGNGVDAVIPASIVLDRLKALASDPSRTATRDADKAALDTLAARGYDDKELTHMRSLVDIAMAGAKSGAVPDDMVKHTKDLKAMYDWYVDWSETAKVLVPRRVDLIRLGLAKRQKHVVPVDPTPPTAPGATLTPGTTTSPSPSPSPRGPSSPLPPGLPPMPPTGALPATPA